MLARLLSVFISSWPLEALVLAPVVVKPRADRTDSLSFVETILLRLSAVSILRLDYKT